MVLNDSWVRSSRRGGLIGFWFGRHMVVLCSFVLVLLMMMLMWAVEKEK